MKLIHRTNRNFIIAALLVLPLAAVFLFFGLNYFLKSEIDEQLVLDETRIIENLKVDDRIFSVSPIIEINNWEGNPVEKTDIFDVEVFDPLERENEPFRELHSVKQINNHFYEIKIRHSTIENEDVLMVIGLIMLILLLLVVIGMYFLNNRASQKAWKPFYRNLEIIKNFSLESKVVPVFENSKIDEFKELSDSLTILTSKLKSDYNALKEFTENASHEIQTPLSVISMNLEEMLQEDMSEANYTKLYKVLRSTQKLSRLNEKLLLLTKLENKQFQQLEKVNFTNLIRTKIEELQPIIEQNELNVQIQVENDFCFPVEYFLANFLIDNVLSNSIKHNNEKRIIQIKCDSNELTVSNSTSLRPDLEKVFLRFHKQSNAENSVGLGLSLVKKIADAANMSLSVTNESGFFTLRFSKK